ncbi:sugar transferase [bacterium]|nr:MAG: sugar transferase [bacterium]
MKRCFDFFAAVLGVTLMAIPMLLIAFVVKVTSKGPVLYWSGRVGRNNEVFRMAKFRTMKNNTLPVATHLLVDSARYVTPVGSILRKLSLDELPQLFNILRGEMSFVGPRPALFNQNDLIALRTAKGIQLLTPGLTGWAQINGRDGLSIPIKVELDDYYSRHRSFLFDIEIILRTFMTVLRKEGVSH